MIRYVPFFAALMLAGAPLKALEVPSGQPIELWEVLVDEVGTQTWLRFRFLAPEITKGTGSVSFDAVEGDFEVLCTNVALPYIDQHALPADVVVISLLDRPVDFGQSDPDATQYIDVFRRQGDVCVWEAL